MSSLLTEWRNRLLKFEKLYVGYSGGLDSTVLLHCLAKDSLLASRVSAIHVNHGLSEHANEWQAHCKQICNDFKITFNQVQIQIDNSANIEERARIARYEAFATYLSESDGLVLAHHQDDQAETVLLQLMRGTGIDGLAGMPEIRSLKKGQLLRPLLNKTREELESYAKEYKLSWIEDESNKESYFSRNYLRHQVMPILRAHWPGFAASIAQTAVHCKSASINLSRLASIDCEFIRETTLPLENLYKYDEIVLANILINWLKYNQVKIRSSAQLNCLIHEVLYARKDAMPALELDKVVIRRYQNKLYICAKDLNQHLPSVVWSSFPNQLNLSDGRILLAKSANSGIKINPKSKIEIRFRCGGESMRWHGQTKSLKKLFQIWSIPHWKRDKIPLLFIDFQIAAVVGFAISDDFYATNVENIYAISTK